MTQEEYNTLKEILSGERWKALHRLDEFIRNAQITNEQSDQRTHAQNNALHLYFEQVATALNDAGLDMRAVIKEEVEIPWSLETVKEYLWKPVQKLTVGKDKTSHLSKIEVSQVFEVFNRHIAKHGVHVPFPEFKPLMTAVENLKSDNYPEYEGPPTI